MILNQIQSIISHHMKGKKPQKVQEPAITEEDKQNDPFIRAIAKKVRNINKKTLDIEVLEKRDDLKPEQLEKINSKQNLLDERKRLEDFVKFYKSTLVEAANEKEAKQVSPVIGKLSHSLILAHYLSSGAEVKELQLNGHERKVLTNIASVGRQEATLNDLGNQLSGYFVEYIDNQKLISKVEELFSNEKTGGLRVNLYARPETQQPVPVAQQPKQEVQGTPQKVAPVAEPAEPAPVQPAVIASNRKQIKEQTAPVAEVTQAVTENSTVVESAVKQEQPATGENPPTEGQTQAKQEGAQRDQKPRTNKPYNKRPYRPREGEQGYRGDTGYNKRGGYKPKYNEKRGEEEGSGDEQEENVKTTFNNKEMRDLQNDGFVIVQKKQKPKDTNESAAFYRKQHGFKDKRSHDHHN